MHIPGDNSPPVVQLRSFAGVIELPGWDKGCAAGEPHGGTYLEHRMLDPLNLPFMARELFNAKDGWEGEPAAVFSCGVLFQTLYVFSTWLFFLGRPPDSSALVGWLRSQSRRPN